MQIGIAIILDENRQHVLARQRPEGTHLAGFWEFPGGKVEFGESPEKCILRETLEETGFGIKVVDTLTTVDYAYPERTVSLMPAICDIVAGGDLDRGWIWLPIADIRHYQFPPANDSIIDALMDQYTESKL